MGDIKGFFLGIYCGLLYCDRSAEVANIIGSDISADGHVISAVDPKPYAAGNGTHCAAVKIA